MIEMKKDDAFADKGRRRYAKPELRRVELRPEESLAGGCKTSSAMDPGATGCATNSCFDIGS